MNDKGFSCYREQDREAEHSENTDIEITIVRFAPVEMRGLFKGIDTPVLKLEIWCE